MVRIETARDAVVVEGDLLEDASEEFGQALESLRKAPVSGARVDLSRVTAVAARPVELLFGLWLDLFRRGRTPCIEAPPYVWQMLGRAAVDHGLLRKTEVALQAGRAR